MCFCPVWKNELGRTVRDVPIVQQNIWKGCEWSGYAVDQARTKFQRIKGALLHASGEYLWELLEIAKGDLFVFKIGM